MNIKKVIFFGDSITYGQYIDPKYIWTTIITNNLNKKKDLITFRNAVSGETSRQLLLRFSRDVQEIKPDILTIQCGLNDCNYWQSDKGLPRVSKESYKANLNEMIDRAQVFNTKKIIFIGSHPVTKKIYGSKTLEESRREYNQIFKEVAQNRQITYIDIESQFNNIDEYLLDDGIHLSKKGHIKYAEIIEPYIRNLCKTNILILGQNKLFEESLLYLHENIDKIKNSFNFIVIPSSLSLKNIKSNKTSETITSLLDNISLLENKKNFTIIIKFYNICITNECIKDLIKEFDIKILISIQYPRIISEEVLKVMNYQCFNLHNAKLPNYRGHNSLTHEIINNDEFHTITIHRMAKIVDRGAIILEKNIKYENNDTAYSMYNKCIKKAKNMLVELILKIKNKNIIDIPIKGKGKYYSINLEKKIPDNLTEEERFKYFRAFYFPGKTQCYEIINGEKVYLNYSEHLINTK